MKKLTEDAEPDGQTLTFLSKKYFKKVLEKKNNEIDEIL